MIGMQFSTRPDKENKKYFRNRRTNENMIIKLPLLCRSKKNSQQILRNKKTGQPFVSQSKLYKEFERDCGYFLKRYASNINTPINIKATFYVPNRRKRDLTNLLNAVQDVLVKYNVLADDNSNIIKSVDGSRIIYRKNMAETIIEITEYKEEDKNTRSLEKNKRL